MIFVDNNRKKIRMNAKPLAERMRPNDFEGFLGQDHLTGKGAVLRQAVENKNIPSMILWGPPGVGKTTLAQIISQQLNMMFFALSAVQAGVREVRQVIEAGKKAGKVLLFIDEIHRFNKGQQDALLGAIEKGQIIFIGATTENPSFEVNSALLSRCQVFILKELGSKELKILAHKAIQQDEELSKRKIEIKEWEAFLRFSGGDARKILNLLELLADQFDGGDFSITNELIEKTLQSKLAVYDKKGEMHYDIISAFIKSLRGSDPNAAVYYLARMLNGGEDPKFIARRMLILASEDIGNANPTALVLANNCFQAVNVTGMPEGRIILSQTAIYLASSPKSNASYQAINKSLALVEKTGNLPVPLHLRNAPTKLMKDLNYGKDYKYAHNYEGNFTDLEFLPGELKGTKLYDPGNNERENVIRKHLRNLWKGKYGY